MEKSNSFVEQVKSEEVHINYGGFIQSVCGKAQVSIPALGKTVAIDLTKLDGGKGVLIPPEKLISKTISITEYHYDESNNYVIDEAISAPYKNKTIEVQER